MDLLPLRLHSSPFWGLMSSSGPYRERPFCGADVLPISFPKPKVLQISSGSESAREDSGESHGLQRDQIRQS